jgi:HAD superfamily hydrolase (TIGR01509 family)
VTDAVFIFDLDGTLVDNVYEHVLAWKAAFEEQELFVSTWRIHRHIGMSGERLVRELAQTVGVEMTPERSARIHTRHGEIFKASAAVSRPLPGARELLAHLSAHTIPWAIATSGLADNAAPAFAALGVDPGKAVIITGDQVKAAKPAPDLFIAAAERLRRPVAEALVVGDAVWDMEAALRAQARPIGLLSGGTSAAELTQAGAAQSFDDPADLLKHITQVTAQFGGGA